MIHGNEITIKDITDKKITFTWFVYRLAGIDDDLTIDFFNGKGIFYYQGYDDKNFDGIETEDEKYIRKATITVDKNGVTVKVEDVTSIDNNFVVIDDSIFAGQVYVEKGTYTHPTKK